MCSGWLYLELTDGFFPILWLPLPDCPFFSALSGTVDDSLVGNAWVLVDPSRSALPDPSAFVIPTAVPVLAESSAAVAAAAAAAVAASVSSPPRPPPPSLATMWMLPLEVLLRITAFLGVRHLLEVESLCRASRSAILCDPITRSSIWKSQCRRRDWLPLTMPVDLGPDQVP
ncbi:hypothetical protein DFJ73DRAFT_849723 [Zopfochytrium polystomum]|nr:hypothetical protein DFJ73DRAFT_849723 [Zopfochytrium polystomum]